MRFDVILNAAPQARQFPVIRLEDGTPCIVGDQFCKVFLADGGHTATHPYTEPDKQLCEVHPGDFIGVREDVNGTIFLRTYRVNDVSGSHVRYTII